MSADRGGLQTIPSEPENFQFGLNRHCTPPSKFNTPATAAGETPRPKPPVRTAEPAADHDPDIHQKHIATAQRLEGAGEHRDTVLVAHLRCRRVQDAFAGDRHDEPRCRMRVDRISFGFKSDPVLERGRARAAPTHSRVDSILKLNRPWQRSLVRLRIGRRASYPDTEYRCSRGSDDEGERKGEG